MSFISNYFKNVLTSKHILLEYVKNSNTKSILTLIEDKQDIKPEILFEALYLIKDKMEIDKSNLEFKLCKIKIYEKILIKFIKDFNYDAIENLIDKTFSLDNISKDSNEDFVQINTINDKELLEAARNTNESLYETINLNKNIDQKNILRLLKSFLKGEIFNNPDHIVKTFKEEGSYSYTSYVRKKMGPIENLKINESHFK